MSQKCLKTFLIRKCPDDCIYRVSIPYKVFNLLTLANISEKNTSGFTGMGGPVALGCHRNQPLKNLNYRCIDAQDNFDDTRKKCSL